MTARGGIIHQEMPHGDDSGRMHGFQLRANLPASLKMTAPRYQDIKAADIPEIIDDDGTRIRVISGNVWGATGPVDGIAADPHYVDIWVPPETRKRIPVETARQALRTSSRALAASPTHPIRSAPRPSASTRTALLDGHATPSSPNDEADNRSLVLFDGGDEVTVEAGERGIRFLLVSRRPLREPVAWYGPVVMNTREQLQQAFAELQAGTFLRDR